MDEEPYNLATYLGLAAAARRGIPALFFTWQNIYRRYPPPFVWMEQANYRRAALALVGNADAAAVLHRKGYAGQLRVIPQFGVDPEQFSPRLWAGSPEQPLCVGYAGGLLPEKGVDLLLAACAGLMGEWRLQIVGEGDQGAALNAQARNLGIEERVVIAPRLPSEQMPAFYRGLDVLVLPSRTTPAWVEQFGRVLIEAMACAVPVVGSASGEIPQVIGDAGLLFPEGDVAGLRGALQRLLDEPALRLELAERGRTRVMERYTMSRIAQETVNAYSQILDCGVNPKSKIQNPKSP
jgi:glycosyltransferase involved in cell wall biosynthesis